VSGGRDREEGKVEREKMEEGKMEDRTAA